MESQKQTSKRIDNDRFCSKKGDFVFKKKTKEPAKVAKIKTKA